MLVDTFLAVAAAVVAFAEAPLPLTAGLEIEYLVYWGRSCSLAAYGFRLGWTHPLQTKVTRYLGRLCRVHHDLLRPVRKARAKLLQLLMMVLADFARVTVMQVHCLAVLLQSSICSALAKSAMVTLPQDGHSLLSNSP